MADGRWWGEFIVKDGEFIDELVRCKDCIHSTPAIIDGQRKCELLLMTFFDDDFCSMGERREDETD